MDYIWHDSPTGPLLLAGDAQALCYISFSTGKTPLQPKAEWRECGDSFTLVRQQLDEYFSGTRQSFELPLRFVEGTDFQRQVWQGLLCIPFGETWSYGDLARHIGNPNAVRAVGLANGGNPMSIVVPCHRVIGADGSLTGFGGGLANKRWLLAHEGSLRTSEQMDLPL